MADAARRRLVALGLALVLAAPFSMANAQAPARAPASSGARSVTPHVVMSTALGDIEIELYPARAPATAGNFLAYVDKGLWKGASFYRVVRPDNDRKPAISVVQGGLSQDRAPLPPIVHETTAKTGLRHTDGVLSMARGGPGTAASEFFISVGANPSLDFGGGRNPDGLGFATFGRVVRGMEIVRLIDGLRDPVQGKSEFMPGQQLAHPVAIVSMRRVR